MNILVNLPPGFFGHPSLAPAFERLHTIGEVRTASHNTADEIRADLVWADAVIMWSWPVFTDELLDQAPNLKYSGQLDVSQSGAKVSLSRGLPVSVSRSGWSPAVSEMALALTLGVLRKTSDYHTRMRAGTEPWVDVFPTDIDPLERELTGRPVGIVGFGNVGRRLAELLTPFRCQLLVCDPFVPETVLDTHGAKRASLHEMIQGSDVVVLCAASNSGTKHLIGQAEFALFRKDAVLVNVARAALVDTDALIDRLKLGGFSAAIDVFDKEPLQADAALRALPNAYLTPHRAGGTIASVLRTITWLIDDLEAVLAGRPRAYALVEAMIPSLDA
jgi:phosphoglycerate dehydrogenase-like enzyme